MVWAIKVCNVFSLTVDIKVYFPHYEHTALTNALRLETTPSQVGQTSARDGALQ